MLLRITASIEWHRAISCQTQKETKHFSTREPEVKKSAQLSLWFRPRVTTLTVGQHAQASLSRRAMNDSELKMSSVYTQTFTEKCKLDTQKTDTQIYLNCSFHAQIKMQKHCEKHIHLIHVLMHSRRLLIKCPFLWKFIENINGTFNLIILHFAEECYFWMFSEPSEFNKVKH